MSLSLRIQHGVLLVCLFLVPSDYILVTKHKPKAAKQSSGNRNNKSRLNETVREKYTTGVCQEGNDDVTLYKQTHEQCFTECRSRSLCTAINFYTKVGVCRLNLQENLTTKVCQKYIFSEKKNWKQRSIPDCENQQCPKTHKCTVRQGKPICFATGCENIKSVAHGVMFGNLVEVGKSRGFRCNKGYNLIGSKKITCHPNGQWSDKVPICAAVATTTAKHDTRTSATASQGTTVKPSQAPSSRTTTPETPPPSSTKQTKTTTTPETTPPSSTTPTKTTTTTETPPLSSTTPTKTTTTTETPPPPSTTPTKTTTTETPPPSSTTPTKTTTTTETTTPPSTTPTKTTTTTETPSPPSTMPTKTTTTTETPPPPSTMPTKTTTTPDTTPPSSTTPTKTTTTTETPPPSSTKQTKTTTTPETPPPSSTTPTKTTTTTETPPPSSTTPTKTTTTTETTPPSSTTPTKTTTTTETTTPPSSTTPTKTTTTTETPPPSSTTPTKTTTTTETPPPSSTTPTKTTATTETPPPSSTMPTKTTTTTETPTSLASSTTPTATTTTEPNRTGQNEAGNKSQSDASSTEHSTTNTLPTYTSYPNTDHSSTDSTKADQHLTMKDRIDFQYNSHCNTTNQCVVEHLECREEKCQCIFPRVYDPRHDICVEAYSPPVPNLRRHNENLTGETPRTVETTITQQLLCTFYENPLSKMVSQPNNTHITFLRDCYDPGAFNTVDSDSGFNDKTYASLAPDEETSEHTETSTDPSKTGESGTDNSDDDLSIDDHESNDDIATSVQTSSNDTSSTDVPGAAVQEWQDNKSTSAESGLKSDEDSTATSINVADDLINFGDAADFINHESCVPGTVYSQIRKGCTHDCNSFTNTFQFYQSKMLDFSRDEILGRSSSITECLYNCTMTFRCNAVTGDKTGCQMLYYKSGIPAADVHLNADSTDAYVRDCK